MFEERKMKMIAVAVAVILLVAVPLIYLNMNPTDDSDEDTSEALITVEGNGMKLDDLEEMEIVSGTSSYQNRFGNWNDKTDYEGVPLNTLVDDMDENDVLEVTATDGYSQKFSYEQVNPTAEKKDIQGDIILAYSQDGDKVPDWEEGPRIAVLAPDEEFSNCDLNLTKSLASDFSSQTSAGSLWVKNVEKIEVLEDVYSDAETALTLQGTTTHDYTMEEIQGMESYTGEGSRLNSVGNINGPYEYRGVNVTKLVSNMYCGDDYTLEVEASDGYKMTYSYEHVNGEFTIFDENGDVVDEEGQVNLMLAYEEIGEDELNGGPLRIVTVSEKPKITESHFWAKMVRYMRIKGAEEDWTVQLSGIESVEMDKQTFESASTCDYHNTTYEDDGDTYSGLPLWILVSAVDGADAPDGHYMFNSELAEKGYNVTLTAGDDYSVNLPSQMVARNNSILVANRINGEPLPEGDFPLRLVGEGLSGKQKIKNIVEIQLTDLPQMAEWTLTLTGEVVQEYDAGAFNSMVDCGVHTAYHNYTDEGTDYSYEGVPLWVLVGAVDDDESGDHWTLNDTLVSEGYQVKVIAEDGYNYSFDISQVAYNDSIIVASRLNGEPLPEEDAPLRIVGEGLSGMQKVSMVVEIKLTGL